MIDIKNKTVLVVGLGVSGYAAAELLLSKGVHVKITEVSDDNGTRERLKKLLEFSVEYELGEHTKHFCEGVDLIIVSPGVDPASLPLIFAKENQIPIIGELELGFQFCKAPIIAVTGTNGKSTTTELIGKIFSVSGRHTVVCGNIGNPLCGEVNNLKSESVAVVEVSSFQLEPIKEFKPHAAILLNISEDHFCRHGGYDNYKTAKFNIFQNQDENDWSVFHSDFHDDPNLNKIKGQIKLFGYAGNDVAVEGKSIVANINGTREELVRIEDIRLKGVHNIENVICSILVSLIMGIDKKFIREGIVSFDGLRHRFERIGSYNGIEFIDDSKATNIDATKKALQSINKKVVLIAGGKDKGGDYLSILPMIKEKVKAVVLIGETRKKIKDIFSDTIPVIIAQDMTEAVKTAVIAAVSGEAVVLSPMCSSFDMFSSYKERGEAFRSAVMEQISPGIN